MAAEGSSSSLSATAPTSYADDQDRSSLPRSKRALSPASQHAAHLAKLMANPAKPVHIPGPAKEKEMRAPRETMKNVSGSSAGAGSGEFHVYKHARRREYERIKLMEDKEAKEQQRAQFSEAQQAAAAASDAKTNKNKARRDKKKEAKRKAASSSGSGGGGEESGRAGKPRNGEEGAEPQAKRIRIGQAAAVSLETGEDRAGAASGGGALKFKRRTDDDDEEDEEDGE
ncbi:hypothetical protein OC845_003074 [Tilletia horrida]|nr:hypothetical protein OC845_003074 [Tilletia horrida]